MWWSLLSSVAAFAGAWALLSLVATGSWNRRKAAFWFGGGAVILTVLGAGSWALCACCVAGAVALGLRLRQAWHRLRAHAQFRSQFVDALTILASALRAGLTLLQGFEIVHKELPEPLSAEFGRVLQEVRLGVDWSDALQGLRTRYGWRDLELFVTAVEVHRTVGGNLAEVLERLAAVQQRQERLRGKLRATTAQGRMTASVVALLPFVLLAIVSTLSPELVAPLWESRTGHLLLVGALVLELIGLLSIRRLMALKF